MFVVSILLSCMLQSCDAVLVLAYRVKNNSSKPVKLRIKNYIDQPFSRNAIDTAVVLYPHGSFIVGMSLPDIGFPGEEKLIYKEHPSCNNFSLVKGDSIIVINPTDMEWKYNSGYSTYRITNKNLPFGY